MTALAAVEAATADVRRALLTGSEAVITDASERLERVTGEFFLRLREPDSSPATPTLPASQDTEKPDDPIVTKPVTEEAGGRSTAKPRRPRRPLTAPPARKPPVDVSTIRLVRREAEEPGWRVLAGPEDGPEVLGFLAPAYSRSSGRPNGRWDAVSTGMSKLSGGPWKNRGEAIARLVAGRDIEGTR